MVFYHLTPPYMVVYIHAMKKGKLTPILVGCAGEYLVAGELSRRGYVASITLRNSKGVDILVTNDKATKTVAIQVKTHYGKGTEWVLGAKAEEYHAPKLFYVFVSLNNGEPADFYIVPSRVVADFTKKYNQEYLARGRKPNKMRKFRDDQQRYLNAYSLMKL